MPYIDQSKQQNLSRLTAEIDLADIPDSGSLNFLLTKLAVRYMRQHGLRYSNMNDVVGALNGALAEFQRRVVTPYEDQKAFEVSNAFDGDPYVQQR